MLLRRQSYLGSQQDMQSIPDSSRLEFDWCSGKDSSWEDIPSLAAIHNSLRDGGECSERFSQRFDLFERITYEEA